MLRISKLSDYATALLAQMAARGDAQVSAQQLAVELGLPPQTVARLLKQVARAGLVVSQRGKGGGYRLARAPAEISVAQVITAIDGPVALTECALGEGRCDLEHDCTTKANWRLISQAVRVALEGVSLANLRAPRVRSVQVGWSPGQRVDRV